MFCQNCGQSLSDTAKFCPSCGKNVEQLQQLPKVNPTLPPKPAERVTNEETITKGLSSSEKILLTILFGILLLITLTAGLMGLFSDGFTRETLSINVVSICLIVALILLWRTKKLTIQITKEANAVPSSQTIFIIAIVSFLFIATSMYYISQPKAPPAPAKKATQQQDLDSDSTWATSWAEIFVKDSLKSPSTAKFQDAIDFAVAPPKDKKGKIIKDVWEVSGYVDAQNSFGAMLRHRFYIKLKKINDTNWVPLKIVFSP